MHSDPINRLQFACFVSLYIIFHFFDSLVLLSFFATASSIHVFATEYRVVSVMRVSEGNNTAGEDEELLCCVNAHKK